MLAVRLLMQLLEIRFVHATANGARDDQVTQQRSKKTVSWKRKQKAMEGVPVAEGGKMRVEVALRARAQTTMRSGLGAQSKARGAKNTKKNAPLDGMQEHSKR